MMSNKLPIGALVGALTLLLLTITNECVDAFSVLSPSNLVQTTSTTRLNQHLGKNDDDCIHKDEDVSMSRRSLMRSTSTTAAAILTSSFLTSSSTIRNNGGVANAAVGTLPEFSDGNTNAILQGLTVDVSDKAQLDKMITFLEDGFTFKVLRQRTIGPITDVWMGYGPEQLSIPPEFEIPVSSFNTYGGHASIHIRYDSQTTNLLFKPGNDSPAPGDSIAYLQVGVPEYRISQMVKNDGNILDAYGIVNVISPAGLPMRGIIGISPDPMMFVAVNCVNVKESQSFYESLGFVEQEYPYARPNKGLGQFEPQQPANSVYMAPSPYCMGVLLLQGDKKLKKKGIKVNPVLRSLNIVYTPNDGGATSSNDDDVVVDTAANAMKVVDPSQVPVSFIPVDLFEKEERLTRVKKAVEKPILPPLDATE